MSNTISELKSETSRINGAKSQGPITQEGSSANSRKHGLTSAAVMPFGENKEHFQLLLADYMDQFQPQTGVETELLESMAVSRWRLRRLVTIETQRFDQELSALDPDFINNTDAERLAMIFKNMTEKGHGLSLLLRYEAT